MTYIPVLQMFLSDPEIPGATPTGYILTEHNRGPVQFSYEVVQDSNRMADGTMRRFITANKKKAAISWKTVPAAGGRNFTVDGNLGAAFMKSFYEENVYRPVWIKMTYASESWRFANSVPDTPAGTGTASGTNSTFSPTVFNGLVQFPFAVIAASVSNFTAGVASATLTTSVPHTLTPANSPYVFVSGIDQVYNGTWKVSSASGSQIVFTFVANGNASADFTINSYVQNGASATFNIDNNDFIQNNMNILVLNSKTTSGTSASINGTWVVTGKSGTTLFTASNAVASGSSIGYYGTGVVSSGNGSGKTVTQLAPGVVGPAISSDIFKTFITNFTYDITHRQVLTDYADVSIEFTEI